MVNKQKYLSVNKLYDIWARKYDCENNLLMFLEAQTTKKLFQFSRKEVLDLGCGTGRYSIAIAKKNNVTAVDFNKQMLEIAEKKARKAGVKVNFERKDIIQFESNKKFDVIISMLVQDHIKDLDKVAQVINNASKPGTEVFISNVSPDFEKVEEKVKKTIFMNFYTDEYYHPLKEYIKVFRKYGFKLVDKKSIIFKKEHLSFIEINNPEAIVNKTLGVLYKFVKKMIK